MAPKSLSQGTTENARLKLSTKGMTKAASDSGKIFRQAFDMVDSLLAAMDYRGTDGRMLLQPRNQLRWQSQERLTVRQIFGQAIRIRVRPGGSDTAWDYDLVPPTGINPEMVLGSMRAAAVQKGWQYSQLPLPASEVEAPTEDDLQRQGEAEPRPVAIDILIPAAVFKAADPDKLQKATGMTVEKATQAMTLQTLDALDSLREATERQTARQQQIDQREARLKELREEVEIERQKLQRIQNVVQGIESQISTVETEQLEIMREMEEDAEAKQAAAALSALAGLLKGFLPKGAK